MLGVDTLVLAGVDPFREQRYSGRIRGFPLHTTVCVFYPFPSKHGLKYGAVFSEKRRVYCVRIAFGGCDREQRGGAVSGGVVYD